MIATSSKDLLQQLQQRGEGTSLAPGFLAIVLMLAVVEAMMANRHRPPSRTRKSAVAFSRLFFFPEKKAAASSCRRPKNPSPET